MNRHIQWLQVSIKQSNLTESMRITSLESLLKLQSELDDIPKLEEQNVRLMNKNEKLTQENHNLFMRNDDLQNQNRMLKNKGVIKNV